MSSPKSNSSRSGSILGGSLIEHDIIAERASPRSNESEEEEDHINPSTVVSPLSSAISTSPPREYSPEKSKKGNSSVSYIFMILFFE